MKIGFYIHHTAISAGGIFTYSIGILKQIIKSDEIEKVVVITSKEIKERLNEFSNNSKVKIVIVDRYKISVLTWYSLYYFIYNLLILFEKYLFKNSNIQKLKSITSLINPYRKTLDSEDISLLHVPVQYSPLYKTTFPVIITMHDLQEYHYPEFFSKQERRHRIINNKKAIYDSDHIIVSFNHIKEDIIKYFGIAEEKISVCPPPFAESWFISKDETGWEVLSKKFKLKKNYLLYPAATWRHKNHLILIKALKNLIDNGTDINLVCTGNKTGYFQTIQSEIERLELSGNVHFLGIVSEEDLIGLYKNSSLVVIPTLYEAGSGPLYEAMQYKIPVICSNVTSLPETMNNNEFIFDPENVEDIKEKISKMLNDRDYREKNLQNSKERIEYFKTIDPSVTFIKAYKQILNSRKN